MMHPTRERLLDTVQDLAMEKPLETLTVDQVLSASEVSRGSLYHHFDDFFHLIEEAEARRLERTVNTTLTLLDDAFRGAATGTEVVEGLLGATTNADDTVAARVREARVKAIARAAQSERFRETFKREQNRFTAQLSHRFAELQQRGLISEHVNPLMAAAFCQNYLFGRAVEEIADSSLDPAEWKAFLRRVIERTLLD